MIFWVLLVIAVAVIVISFTWALNDWVGGWGFAFLTAFLAAALSAIIGGGLVALSLLIPGKVIRPTDYELRAIATSSTVQGRFFLGSGYINGSRSLNYIKREDGWSSIDSAVASASRVFEDSENPTVTEYEHVYSNGWVIPWEFRVGWTYDFHIPEGAILEDYTITNE